jgi:epoxide hydrolase-like predicted phosphatase
VSIRAVILDIGGVLEVTPRTRWEGRWAARLRLTPDALRAQLRDVWRAGSIGAMTEHEVEARTAAMLGLDETQRAAFMHDLWEEYLGTLNTELAAYFGGLRPRYRTGILSNSFVGAREREQARYGFGDLCDCIVYSHEEGVEKPDPRSYHLICARLGVRPAEALFLDDVEGHVAAARALGMHAVRFTTTPQAIADIEAILDREGSGR